MHCNTYFTLYFLNPTSLAKPHAIQQLETDLTQHSVDICLIVETFFCNNHVDNYVSINRFNIFRRDRGFKKGGGLCAYIRDSIVCNRLNLKNCADAKIEIMWLQCIDGAVSYYIACCYFPPKPDYNSKDFVNALCLDLDDIVSQPGDFIILVAGDFNQLDTSFLESDYGLIQLVSTATHGNNILDKVFTNRPDLYNACVLKSLIKTKHAAVLISNEPAKLCYTKRKTAELWDLRQHNIDRLRFAICSFDWHCVLNCDNVCDMYDRFLDVITMLMRTCIPVRKVTLGIKEPSFHYPPH